MSDFLDRLAARAIGGGTALAPRLPSLFEPLQRAPIMPLSGDGEPPPGHHETVSASTTAPTAAPMRPPLAPAATVPDTSRVAPAALEPVSVPLPTRVAASASRHDMPPSPPTAVPAPPLLVERSVALPVPPQIVTPSPIRPRQSRIATEHPESASPSHPPNGALLPAPAPVFGTTRADAPGRSMPVAALRTLAAPAGLDSASSEPVVHVSIGRLEVRAAPAPTTPTRRRDGPQPSSLDDYLRQRGKASP
ncbi:hypothetical protein [Rhodanobacter sp. T12-5]|uniref:hypothetical protein n=1 Tax=Rhodanobacter sp. T12-5 TaxID=2024611 RepID=UPI0011F04842|nr:hypothetical protein [Rhodanobacter sp. T12-5]KAA0068671.1 hypothetical protein CIW53_15475 [Rhodanobacter sp. T12-5]